MCDNKKVLQLADKYAKPDDRYEWRIYWKDMSKVLADH